MKKIFFKYIYLNNRNLIFGVLSACFFALIAFDSNKYYSVALLMVPSLLFNFIVGKMCYEEDSKATKEFLLAMPILKRDIALEKNIIGQICIVVGFCLVNVVFWIVNILFRKSDMFFDMDTMLIIMCFLIVYNTIYIFMNYKFDYSKTQFSSYIVLAVMLILFKFGNEFEDMIDCVNSYFLFLVVVVISIGSSLITKKYNSI